MNTHIHETTDLSTNKNRNVETRTQVSLYNPILLIVMAETVLLNHTGGKCNLRLAVSACTCTLVWEGLDLPREVKDKKTRTVFS